MSVRACVGMIVVIPAALFRVYRLDLLDIGTHGSLSVIKSL